MYQLERGSKKYICPECNQKAWVRYVDSDKENEYLPEKYGRCDREVKCGHSLNPYADHYLFDSGSVHQKAQILVPKRKSRIVFFSKEALEATFTPEGYQQNIFLQNLGENVPFPFDRLDIEQVISQYYLGSIKAGYRTGAVTFPFIDIDKNIRTVQVKQFDKNNHATETDFLHSIINRDKATPNPDWLDSYLKNDSYVSCLFGEHLLNDYRMNPVALVEAPKTAIYGTLYFGSPENPRNMIWLGVYNLSSLNASKCSALKNRNVYLFPDLSANGEAFRLWSDKAVMLNQMIKGSKFEVSTLLEQNATIEERAKGLDFADYLIVNDWREFRPKKVGILPSAVISLPKKLPESEESVKSATQINIILKGTEERKPDNWDDEIAALDIFFEKVILPDNPLKLSPSLTIQDVSAFIRSSLTCIRAQNGKNVFKPYLIRLQILQSYLQEFKYQGKTDVT